VARTLPSAAVSDRVRRLLPVVFLVLAILIPYHRLVTMSAIIVTDDRILSDVYHGEFPARFEVARLIRAGELPLWTPRLCTGYPLNAAVFPDPLTLLTFVPLPSVVALNVFVLITLIVAALGTYGLARRFGASPLGGTLAGLSFSWSGYMVCQLKHLGIVATVCWLPSGLWLLDRALAIDDEAPLVRRLRALCPFAMVVALQWISNFPQSAYISSVTYGAFAFAWAIVHARRSPRYGAALLAASVAAIALGIACSAGALLPLRELSSLSDRRSGVTWEFATMLPYSPRDFVTFFLPYIHGDVSDHTYRGSGLFWENYAYVGLLTVFLAFVGAVKGARHVRVIFLITATVVAYLIVLGPATPVFKIVFHALPGMKSFRFPTRWLVVVDLSLAVLGGLGLTYVEEWLRARRATAVAFAIVAVTTADLVFHQLRQNAFADAAQWMKPPATAEFLRAQPGGFRIYTPLHYQSHAIAWRAARGWADIAPYYAHRETIQPNTNLLWGLDTCDCYAGLLPSSSSLVWGELGVINQITAPRAGTLPLDARLTKLLALNAVGFVLSPWPLYTPRAQEVFRTGDVGVYAIPRMPRAFVVAHAVPVDGLEAAIDRTVAREFDPTTAVVLERPFVAAPEPEQVEGRASIVAERATELEIETESTGAAWLVLADQWYPGWHATVDGADAAIARANGRHRAVRVPAGAHRVRFSYTSDSFALGMTISGLAVVTLLGTYLALRRWSNR